MPAARPAGDSETVNEHFDVIIIGSGAGGGTLAHTLAGSGKNILLLERGDFLAREMDNWDPRPVFVDGKYISADTWFDRDGKPFASATKFDSRWFSAASLSIWLKRWRKPWFSRSSFTDARRSSASQTANPAAARMQMMVTVALILRRQRTWHLAPIRHAPRQTVTFCCNLLASGCVL